MLPSLNLHHTDYAPITPRATFSEFPRTQSSKSIKDVSLSEKYDINYSEIKIEGKVGGGAFGKISFANAS